MEVRGHAEQRQGPKPRSRAAAVGPHGRRLAVLLELVGLEIQVGRQPGPGRRRRSG